MYSPTSFRIRKTRGRLLTPFPLQLRYDKHHFVRRADSRDLGERRSASCSASPRSKRHEIKQRLFIITGSATKWLMNLNGTGGRPSSRSLRVLLCIQNATGLCYVSFSSFLPSFLSFFSFFFFLQCEVTIFYRVYPSQNAVLEFRIVRIKDPLYANRRFQYSAQVIYFILVIYVELSYQIELVTRRKKY